MRSNCCYNCCVSPGVGLSTPTPVYFKGAVTRVLCALPPPPAYVDSSTTTQVNNPGRPRGRAALGVPRAPPTVQPIHRGTPPSREQPHLCQCNQGMRAVPSQVQGLGAPVPQAVMGWPAACQLTWKGHVQADYSPGGLCVRCPLPPWSTRQQTTPHARAPPPDAKAPQQRARDTHRPGSISLPRVPLRGLSAVRHALRPRQLGAPNQSSCAGTVALTVGLGVRGRNCPKPNRTPQATSCFYFSLQLILPLLTVLQLPLLLLRYCSRCASALASCFAAYLRVSTASSASACFPAALR